jgi:DNA-binding Xre family transcriptional regulator
MASTLPSVTILEYALSQRWGMEPKQMKCSAFSFQLAGSHTITKDILVKVCEELECGVNVCCVALEAHMEHL